MNKFAAGSLGAVTAHRIKWILLGRSAVEQMRHWKQALQAEQIIDAGKGETIKTNWSRDGLRLKSDNLRRGCRLQDGGVVQGRSESRWRVIAHRRGGREARLARDGIREHDAFLGHEMRGPAGNERGGVSMAGGREGQGARKGNGVRGHRLPSPPCFVQNLLMYFGFLSR